MGTTIRLRKVLGNQSDCWNGLLRKENTASQETDGAGRLLPGNSRTLGWCRRVVVAQRCRKWIARGLSEGE